MLLDYVIDQAVSERSKFYQLMLVFSSLEPLKLKILQVLAHLSPQRVSASELTILLGYSKKARTIYRGVLDELEQNSMIIIDRITPKHFSIAINQHHVLMSNLIELALGEGELYTNSLIDALEDRNR